MILLRCCIDNVTQFTVVICTLSNGPVIGGRGAGVGVGGGHILQGLSPEGISHYSLWSPKYMRNFVECCDTVCKIGCQFAAEKQGRKDRNVSERMNWDT